jgi:hypothetical protein
MRHAISQFLKLTTFFAVFAFLSFLVFHGQYVSLSSKVDASNLNSKAEVSNHRTTANKKSILRSRQSSVRMLSFDVINGVMSTSSATYFRYKDSNFVITTSHGLIGGCPTTQIEAEGELYDCIKVIINDQFIDYAILEIEEIKQRTPLKFPDQMMSGTHRWRKALTLMSGVIYTGYPNSIGPLTVSGSIMGFDPQGLIYVQSYAWSGSSGSGVFDKSGKLIGYIMAIDIGQTEYGTAVLENVLIVVPIYKVDWSVVFKKG